MTKDEALKLALDALEYASTGNRRPEVIGPAITAIKEALAQPEQEHAEQLARLGWQYFECPACGSEGARAFPKPEQDWEAVAADQAMTIAMLKAEQPAKQPDEFSLRGLLASELKCWHRLTEDEAQNLMDFVQNMPAKTAQQQESVACPYCKNSATLGAVYYDQNCVGCVKRITAPPQRKPLTDAQRKALLDAHNKAMEWALKGRVPECGEFAAIAQDLDYLCDQLAIRADPPQRTWVGLTDEQIDEVPFALFQPDQGGMSATEALREFARAIEAKLKENA